MPSRSFKYLMVFVAPLALAACGDSSNSEMTRVKDIVPYTLERTAGTGVAYVRAKMLPEKSVVVKSETAKPVEAAPKPPVTDPEAVKDMDPVFKKAQEK